MTDIDKWNMYLIFFIVFALMMVGISHFVHDGITQREAVKAGLVQDVKDGKVIWVRKDGQ